MTTRGQPPPEPRFTPDQAARALHRAVERQVERRETSAVDMSLDELVAMAREIGVSEDDIRTAAAMERFTPAGVRDRRMLRLAGAATASGHRVVDGEPADVARRLEEWVRVAHCMKVRDRDTDSTHWEPAGGIAGSLLRGARSLAGEPALEGVRAITTRVAAVDGSRAVVHVDVDPGSRGRALAEAGGTGAAIALGGVALAFVTPFGLVAIPAGAATAIAMLIHRRRRIATAEREIQRLMSGVAHGDRPPRAIDAMRGRLRTDA